MTAKIQSISVSQYSTLVSGHITIADKGISTTITLEEADAHELQATAIKIFERRRRAFAQAIVDLEVAQPLLAGPGPIIDDDMPF